MPIIASAGSGGTFQPAPAGLHQAVCIDVIDMGIVESVYGGKPKSQHKVRLAWVIDELTDEGQPFFVQKRYTLSLHEKSTLRKDLESWRGKPFTDEELKAFDLERLLGVNGQVNVQQVEKNGKTYANVISIVPLGKGMGKMGVPKDYVRAKDREDKATSYNDAPTEEEAIPF